MALREVQPLDKDQWKSLVDVLNSPSTLQQKDLLKKAVENGSKLKVVRK